MTEATTLVVPEPLPPLDDVHLAAAGFLARYSGRTRDAYALDLRSYFYWCAQVPSGESSPTDDEKSSSCAI